MNNSVIKPCGIKPAPGFRLLTTREQIEQLEKLLQQFKMKRVYKQLGAQYLDKVAGTLTMQINAANGVQS